MGIIKQTFKTAKQAQLWKNYLQAETENSRQLARELLLKSLADDKGLTMKIGQFFANQSSDEELKSTVYGNKNQARPFENIQPLVEEELGAPLTELFSEFDREAEAASLGQVHKAKLKDGHAVAVKVQYPGIREEVENQISLFGLTPNVGPAKKWGIPLSEYKNTLGDLLENEVQYKFEADIGSEIHHLFESHPTIDTPAIHPELSCDWILVQSWMDGQSLDQLLQLSADQRRHLADILVEFLFTLLAQGSLVQSDFHRGNFKAKVVGDKVILQAFDFGAVRKISPEMVQSLVNLVFHGGQASKADPITLLTGVGFDPEKLKHIAPQCGEIVRLMAEPFADNYRYDIRHWRLFERIKLALGEDNWWFRSAGNPEFLLVMRAFQGLLGMLRELNVPVSFKDLLMKSAPEQWAEALKTEIPPSQIEAPDLDTLATRLHVRVTDGKMEKANMSLAITCIYDLKSLLDPEILAKVQQQGIELDKLVHEFLKRGGIPGRLFDASYDGKKLEVWAE